MEIKLQEILIKDVFQNYENNDEDGVVGYGGKLNIRPKYQREFIYNDKQRDAVIDTIRKDFPLNVIYWTKNKDGTYEVLDGQQRIISFCSYLNNEYSINAQSFFNLTTEEKEQILNYKLMVYICEGTERERLDWFKIINIAGVRLTIQELRNAIYTGEWLTDAKKSFSKNGCPAYAHANKYLNGTCIRQEYLETAIRWIADKENIEIEEYMAKKQLEKDASELWTYFENVIDWVKFNFPNHRKEMKGIDWGIYYNKYKDKSMNPNDIEKRVMELMQDEDVTNKRGIYEYLIDDKEKHLNVRLFTDKMKREVYEKQKGICIKCNKNYEFDEMEGDHIKAWCKGGKTVSENCQMLCKGCNGDKSGK